jgi:hypothetical protein
MARKMKDKYIGARVDSPYFDRVIAYIDASPIETQGQLVRAAVDEYMSNHPIKQLSPELAKLAGKE